MEDRAARLELSHRWMPGKNKEARIRQDETDKTARRIIDELKGLLSKNFEDMDRNKYGDWWKLKE